MMTCSFLTRRLWELQYPALFIKSHTVTIRPLSASVVCFVMNTKTFSRQVFDILYVINMPSSSPTPSIPNPPTKKSQTAPIHEKTANVTPGPYTAPSPLRTHHKKPPAAELPPHLFCVTLTPPCHVPSPIKKARSKARDSLDIFRRKHNKEHYNGCREEEKNVTIWTSKQEDEEEEEAVSAMWGNWSYTMSPVSLLTHLANEFMDEDKCPSPSPSPNPNPNSTRHIQPRQDDYARVQGRGRRRQRNRSASTSVLASAATSSQRNRSGSDDNGNTSDWPLWLSTSGESAQGRRWRQATGLGTDGPGMARVNEKEKQVGKVGRSSSSSSSGGNESITHEYLKVFENDQDDEGPERYGAGYEGKRIIPDLEAESPEEWEWDRLLEEMEK